LRETKNVVQEQQHVLAFLVTEVFGHGQSGQRTRKRAPGGSFI
jgi:hypothetical protein